nr:LOW QUALITY PROTEIN: F-box only protein 21 [Cavia porcellus]
MAAVAVDSAMEVVPALLEEGAPEAGGLSCLASLPGESWSTSLCSGSLTDADIVSVKLRGCFSPCRWPSLMKHYSPTDYVNWLEEYKVRQKAGLEARKIVASFSKRFFSEHVPCNGFSDIENLEGPEIFFEDELVCILNMEGRKALTWKYYAKKILYYLRQQKILNNLKAFLQQPDDYESYLEVGICVLCNHLTVSSPRCTKELKIPNCSFLVFGSLDRATLDIFDYIYIDAFGKGKQLTVKECEYLIGQHVTAALYGVVNVKKVLQRMVGNLLSLGKREGIDQSYQLLRDSLDLYLAMYPDQVQLLLLQARLYFHLGIWPEKVLDILQHIQTLDPGQHGAVGYLVQHTLEHIERKKEEVFVEAKLRSDEKHRDVCYSIGLIMKHKRYGYNCVIYGWDHTCMMGHEWIRNMNVHSLPHGHHQPFYNVLVEDGSCRYAAQENLEYNVEPQEISHPDVGRYFSEFTGTHYIPNAELEIRYPEDLEFVYETVQNIYSAKKENIDE